MKNIERLNNDNKINYTLMHCYLTHFLLLASISVLMRSKAPLEKFEAFVLCEATEKAYPVYRQRVYSVWVGRSLNFFSAQIVNFCPKCDINVKNFLLGMPAFVSK